MYTLQWTNLTISKNVDKELILKDITGRISSGESLAIMGSSGSGKTTLLKVLANQLMNEVKQISGEVKLINENRNVINGLSYLSGYVMQDELLYDVLTPRELLTFAAELKLDLENTTQIKEIVDNILERLRLQKCADTRIGNVLRKGIAGGEKKRTAIGYQLITNPAVLFLDEPTSNLDSFSAYEMVKILSEEAMNNHRIIIYTIHQPNTQTFSLFDKLLLIAEGRECYMGKARQCLHFFDNIGYSCPVNFNPAEFFMKVLSNGRESSEDDFSSDCSRILIKKASQIRVIEAEAKNLNPPKNLECSNYENVPYIVTKKENFSKEFIILFKRNLTILFRDKASLIGRFVSYFFHLLLATLVYYNIGIGDNAVIDRMGLLSLFIASSFFFNFNKVMQLISKEKYIFYKEQEKKMYGVLPYFMTKTLTEIPIQIILSLLTFLVVYLPVGLNSGSFVNYFNFTLIIFLTGLSANSMAFLVSSLFDQTQVVFSLIPFVMQSQQLASGYLLSQKSYPYALYPIKWISMFRYAYQALLHNEFQDVSITKDLECLDFEKCKSPLRLIDESLFVSIVCLILSIIVFNIISGLSLKYKAMKRK